MKPAYINVRGCNGSGKTTLLRCLARSPDCRLVEVHQPVWRAEDFDHEDAPEQVLTKVGKPKGRPIVATVTPDRLAILGDYTPASAGATTAGCDRISRQADVKAALLAMGKLPDVDAILFEGIIVSTIYSSWQEFSREVGGMTWAFLNTPLDVCLKRVQERNGGKPVKEDQIADKHRGIARVMAKASAAGESVRVLRWDLVLKDIRATIREALGQELPL